MFVSLFVLLSAVSLLSGHRIHDAKGINGRIIGGVDTSIDKIPYQVSLQLEDGTHWCGGSIYSRNVIVTAAHCIHGFKARDFYVRAGSDVYNNGGSLIQASKMAVHERYQLSGFVNDVALLLLSSPLEFGVGIQPISLTSSEPEDGATVLVSGWGVTEFKEVSKKLQSTKVIIVPRKTCAVAYKGNPPISEIHICAAAPGKDACQSDSGGPLVHNNELVGIVSFGEGCADPNYPGVYANVAVLRDWIVGNAARLDSKVNTKK